MDKIKAKPEVKVTLRIEQGIISEAQKQAWWRFWQKLITEVKNGS